MTGAFLNALGILLGALFGLARGGMLPPRTQNFFRTALGVSAACFGLRLVWLSLHGTFTACLKQFFIAALALVLGNWAGRLLRLQKISNRLGRHAGKVIASASSPSNHKAADGFNICTLLFCAAPLGLVGAVADGLPVRDHPAGYFYLLAVKAVMDGLAMAGFVKMFGWFPALSAFPVFALFSVITFICHDYAAPFLDPRGLVDPVNAAAGLIACAVALVVFEARKVELANFLPALAVAPLLAWLWR